MTKVASLHQQKTAVASAQSNQHAEATSLRQLLTSVRHTCRSRIAWLSANAELTAILMFWAATCTPTICPMQTKDVSLGVSSSKPFHDTEACAGSPCV